MSERSDRLQDRIQRPIFQGLKPLSVEAMPLGRQLRSVPQVGAAAVNAIDLTGKRTFVMVEGAGNTGKTFMLRALAEWALLKSDCTAAFAATDPDKHDLAEYFGGIHMPDNPNPEMVAEWIELLITYCIDQKVSGACDFPGGDTSMPILVQRHADLCGMMESNGLHPVALYMVGPRVGDLATLATMEQSGFKPKARAIVLNGGTTDSTMPFKQAFWDVQQHPAYLAAVADGAVVIEMPKLYAADEVERRRLWFSHAAEGKSPEGRDVAPLNVMDRSKVVTWLRQMEEAFEPIRSWLP